MPGVPASLGPFDAPYRFVIFCALAAFCVFVSLRIRTGRLGRAWLAIREDELAASMMGVPLMRAPSCPPTPSVRSSVAWAASPSPPTSTA